MRRLQLDESFPIGIVSYFKNIWVERADGQQIVTCQWSQPLKEFDLSKVSLDPAILDYLLGVGKCVMLLLPFLSLKK